MDFLSSPRVQAMNTAQKGAYLLLLIYAWDDPDCSLPSDQEALTLMTQWHPHAVFGDLTPVLRCFTKHPKKKGRLGNRRLLQELAYVQDKSAKASESGKASALARQKRGEQDGRPGRPITASSDRPSKGFAPIAEEVRSIADKHFPPT